MSQFGEAGGGVEGISLAVDSRLVASELLARRLSQQPPRRSLSKARLLPSTAGALAPVSSKST